MNKTYGIILSIIIAAVSTIIGKKFELIGTPIISIIIGNTRSLQEETTYEYLFFRRYFLEDIILEDKYVFFARITYLIFRYEHRHFRRFNFDRNNHVAKYYIHYRTSSMASW